MVPLFSHFAGNYHLFKALAGTSGVKVMLSSLTRAFVEDWTRRLEDQGRSNAHQRSTVSGRGTDRAGELVAPCRNANFRQKTSANASMRWPPAPWKLA